MKKHGLTVPLGIAVSTPLEAEEAANKLPNPAVVVKAQILAGGRGLGTFKKSGLKGGVKLVKNAAEARQAAQKMLGDILVTKQTGPEGKPVNTVLIANRYQIVHEAYFSILNDRASGGPMLIGSPAGGVNIEDVAHNTPDKIMKIPINPVHGPSEDDTRALAVFMGFENRVHECATLIEKLFAFFQKTDSTMVEVNPLAQTSQGEVMVMDAKVNFDDNAAFRQKEIFAMRDHSQEDPREVEAQKSDLNYIGLDGNIGCLVNGAGLAMATMDIIAQYGGKPANFLDVGGGASQHQVESAIRLISSDKAVEAILVNIFGGIMRCDVIAQGLVESAANLNLEIPLVVRLEGTNVEKGKQIIRDSKLKILNAADLDDAAQKAVAAASIKKLADKAGLQVSMNSR
jgi:succinyl-CoA synthetase beta subunit